MSSPRSIDESIIQEIQSDALKARNYGFIFVISGIFIQVMHFFNIPIYGFNTMLIISSIILIGAGILFIIGSTTVPRTREEIISRLERLMLNSDPKRRLWAAQRLVGYAKDANLTKDEILNLAHNATIIALDPPVRQNLKMVLTVDHIILLRELAVSIQMNKHVRKDFVSIIKPLMKIKDLPDDANEILADAIAYHPDKLPIQAYSDLLKLKEENKENE